MELTPVEWALKGFSGTIQHREDGYVLQYAAQFAYEDWDAWADARNNPKLIRFYNFPPNSGWELVVLKTLQEAAELALELEKLGRLYLCGSEG